METGKSKGLAVAGHEVLFQPGGRTASRDSESCDACGSPIEAAAPGDDDAGYAIAGRARYVWTRGDERRSEEPPLCPSCAAAIGMIALHQWSIEEDEG